MPRMPSMSRYLPTAATRIHASNPLVLNDDAQSVNKQPDKDSAAKDLRSQEWSDALKANLSPLPKQLYRIRMIRHLAIKMLTITDPSMDCFIHLPKTGNAWTPVT